MSSLEISTFQVQKVNQNFQILSRNVEKVSVETSRYLVERSSRDSGPSRILFVFPLDHRMYLRANDEIASNHRAKSGYAGQDIDNKAYQSTAS